MFKPPSLQSDYTLCSEYDEAIALPVVPALTADASEEEREAARKIAEDREHKLKVARDRGDFTALIKPNRSPARFTFRQVPQAALNWWLGEVERQRFILVEQLELLFRIAIKGVDGIGDLKLHHDDNNILTIGSLNDLYRINDNSGVGARVVFELASVVFARVTRGVTPLS